MNGALVSIPRIKVNEAVLRGGNTELVGRELARVDFALHRLHNEFHDIASTMSLDARHGYTTRYALDFDVIMNALDLHARNSYQQFWSVVAIILGSHNIVLLPGTLFELKKYLAEKARHLEGIASRTLGTKLAGLATSLLRTNQSRSQYSSELDDFKSWDVGSRDRYIFGLIQNNLADHQDLPSVDRDLFENAVGFLSRGSRVDRWENNRADAINYGVLHKLNGFIDSNGVRHILVSNTGAMKDLDQAMRATFNFAGSHLEPSPDLFRAGFVWNARSTALHQLLLRAGGGEAGAESVAWKILSNISDYRKRLAETRAEFLALRTPTLPQLEDLLIDVVTSFDDIQRQLDTHTDAPLIALEGTEYQSKDPEKFYRHMEQFIDRRLLDTGYRYTFTREDTSKVPFQLRKAAPFGRSTSFELHDELTQFVARFVEGEEVVLFTECNISLEEFLTSVDTVQAMILSQVTLGKLSLEQLYDDDPKCFEDFVMARIQGKGTKYAYTMSNSSYSALSLSEMFHCFPSDINFVRIDAPLLSYSFEGDIIGISSRYKLPNEFETFLSGVVHPRYKGRDFKTPIDSYFKRTRFDFASIEQREELI